MAAARLRAAMAHAGLRLQVAGRCGDRCAARRRPPRRNPHGPAGGRAAERGQRPRLCHPDQQHQSQARRCERSKPARRQCLRPHHRDDAAGRRSCRRCVRLGDAGSLRRPGRRGGRRAVESRYVEQWLVRLPRQRRGRQSGAAMDLDRPGRQLAAHRPVRRALRARDRRRAAPDVEALLPLPDRRRAVRPLLHA